MTDMDDLITWLRQQLDDDERAARKPPQKHWSYDGTSPFGPIVTTGTNSDDRWTREGNSSVWTCDDVDDGCPEIASEWEAEGEHIARHDPARVLAEVDAKRRIMAIHNRRADVVLYAAGGTFENCCDGCGYEGPCDDPVTENINDCPILRALALPYAARPGYRSEWAP